jgi:hypothetical protein
MLEWTLGGNDGIQRVLPGMTSTPAIETELSALTTPARIGAASECS